MLQANECPDPNPFPGPPTFLICIYVGEMITCSIGPSLTVFYHLLTLVSCHKLASLVPGFLLYLL